MDWNNIPYDPHHLGVPSGASNMISEPMLCSAQNVHQSCVNIGTISKQNEMSFHLSLTHRSAIKCAQNDFWAFGRFGTNHAPILHNTNTVSRQTHDPHYLGVPSCASKQIFEPMVYCHKTCTNLVSRLALSPNGPKRAFTWASSPKNTIRCVQKISEPKVRVTQTVHLSCTNTNTVSKQTETIFHKALITRSSIGYVHHDFWAYGTFGASRAPILYQH
jgi:hypothetical protein